MREFAKPMVSRPGEFLKEEIEARDWTQADFAEIIGRPPRLVSEIINGKRSISPETALDFSLAFDTSAEYWLNLESMWQIHNAKASDSNISLRARLFKKYPVKEMIRRGWIRSADGIAELTDSFEGFFGRAAHTKYRRSSSSDVASAAETAWLHRVLQVASHVQAAKFSKKKLETCFSSLKLLLGDPAECRHVPKVLSDAGIRFVVIEQLLPGSKIDGACTSLGSDAPVVAMTMRLDRIDHFWFTLIHELRHVANEDWKSEAIVDTEIVGGGSNVVDDPIENKANIEAGDFLIDPVSLRSFIGRVSPLYSEEKILGFARKIGVHPGIVVGRLQHLNEIPYSNLRRHLEKVRSQLISTALTDGWGSSVPV